MPGFASGAALAWGMLLLGGLAAAAEPAARPELLPSPRPVAPAVVCPPPAVPAFYRTSQYDVWQYYGVDRQGGFRLRVIYAPAGAYYLYNGAPYPWTITHQREVVPYVVGSAP
jgi:hypothetical protein